MSLFVDPAPGSYRRWFILVMGSLNFVISMFYRGSTAVISPALIRDMDMTGAQLSDLSAAFYYAFALSQLPLGVALDRLGPRITMSILAVAAIGGAVGFAVGQTPGHLVAARVLLGIGMSGNLMVLLTLLAAWFPVDRFAFLSGMAVAVGAAGSLLAATPLAMLSLWIGWRESFLVFAAVNAAVVFAFILVSRDHPQGRQPNPGQKRPLVRGLGRLMRMYSFWAIALASFVRYGYFGALQSLWLGPFLVFGLGLAEMDAGNALFSMGVGYMVGLPLSGQLSDRMLRSRKKVVLPTLIALCLVTLSIVGWSADVPLWLIHLTFFCVGLTSAPGQILYAHIKELLPPAMIAQAMTSVNLFTTLGVGAMIHMLGFVLGGEPSALAGPGSYAPLWYVGVASLAAVSILYSFVPDSRALRPEVAGHRERGGAR
ncbi:MAG: MFS transporter [Desulfomonile tiedjei]|nr:MFS transporter [Desulfomonile tiedjei]